MEGAIYTARIDAIEYIKFKGTIRYSHCSGLEAHIENLFNKKDFEDIAIDMVEARVLDSTALGLLARISIEQNKQTKRKPVILIAEGELLNILNRVCFDQVFNIVLSDSLSTGHNFEQLSNDEDDENKTLQRVVKAHQDLARLADENASLYKDITNALKQ